jgi:hypothetical protein
VRLYAASLLHYPLSRNRRSGQSASDDNENIEKIVENQPSRCGRCRFVSFNALVSRTNLG